jgi:hypothetical protein
MNHADSFIDVTGTYTGTSKTFCIELNKLYSPETYVEGKKAFDIKADKKIVKVSYKIPKTDSLGDWKIYALFYHKSMSYCDVGTNQDPVAFTLHSFKVEDITFKERVVNILFSVVPFFTTLILIFYTLPRIYHSLINWIHVLNREAILSLIKWIIIGLLLLFLFIVFIASKFV